MCIYYSRPLQSQGAYFLLLSPPPPPASAPGLQGGLGLEAWPFQGDARPPHLSFSLVLCKTSQEHELAPRRSAREPPRLLGPCAYPAGGRPLRPSPGPPAPWKKPSAPGVFSCRRLPGGPRDHRGGEVTRWPSCHFPIKQPLLSPFKKTPLATKEPFRLPSSATPRAKSQLRVFPLFVCWVRVLL